MATSIGTSFSRRGSLQWLRPLGVGLTLLAAAGGSAAQVTRCTGPDGKAVYTDQPCAPQQRADTVKVPQSSPPAKGPTRTPPAEADSLGQMMRKEATPIDCATAERIIAEAQPGFVGKPADLQRAFAKMAEEYRSTCVRGPAPKR